MDSKLFPGKRQQTAAVQDPEALDMSYLESWCAIHGTTDRLANILASLPPL